MSRATCAQRLRIVREYDTHFAHAFMEFRALDTPGNEVYKSYAVRTPYSLPAA
jgi:hypothetical protein